MRPQYLLPSSRLLREIATTSFKVSFILRPSIFRYFWSAAGTSGRAYASSRTYPFGSKSLRSWAAGTLDHARTRNRPHTRTTRVTPTTGRMLMTASSTSRSRTENARRRAGSRLSLSGQSRAMVTARLRADNKDHHLAFASEQRNVSPRIPWQNPSREHDVVGS